MNNIHTVKNKDNSVLAEQNRANEELKLPVQGKID